MILPKRLVLLDADSSWQRDAHVEVKWGSREVKANQISLPLYLDERVMEIKSEYLSMVYKIGRTRIGGKSLIEHLKLFDNLSLWWLSSIAEKSPFLNESIYKVFKLRALEKIYLDAGCTELVYSGSESNIHRVLENWCHQMGHVYRRISVSDKDGVEDLPTIRIIFNCLPHFFQVFAWLLKRWWERYRHCRKPKVDLRKKNDGSEVTIVTLFPNIDRGEAGCGKFHSRYWEKLHTLLDNSEAKINWVWFYFSDKDISFSKAAILKDTFNNSNNRQRYFFLEDFLSFRSFFKGLGFYFKIFFNMPKISKIRDAFCFSGSMMNLFPIFKRDWDSSLFGVISIERIFQGVMFDSMAQQLQAEPWGLYTWENQPWELSLISAWRRHNKGSRIIAYEHSSIRPLDLRLFMAPETYDDSVGVAFPVPDILGVNGPAGIFTMAESGYPREKLLRIEALRFFNLSGKYGSERKPIKEAKRTIMVVMGMIRHEACFQLNLLNEAWQKEALSRYNKILIKPHPGFDISSLLHDLKLDFEYEVIEGVIDNFWGEVDAVYCANSSGVCLEVAWLGIPLIVSKNFDTFNLNPLLGLKGLKFVANASQLSEELEEPRIVEIPEDYFFFDQRLESWRDLLEFDLLD